MSEEHPFPEWVDEGIEVAPGWLTTATVIGSMYLVYWAMNFGIVLSILLGVALGIILNLVLYWILARMA